MARIDRSGSSGRVLAVADQCVSSGSNFLIAVLIAQNVTTRTFGIYAILASLYWFALGGSRALVGEPLLILRRSLAASDHLVDRKAAGAGLLIGVIVGAPLLPLGAISDLRSFAVLSIGMPILLWQDTMRYALFAQSRPGLPLVADTVWLVTEAGIGAALLSRHVSSLSLWIAVWAGSALLSGLVLLAIARIAPQFAGIRTLARTAGRTSTQMFGDFFFTVGAQQVVVFALPLVSSLSVLGALKAAQVAIGPLSVLVTAAAVLAIPRIAAASERGRFDTAIRYGWEVAGLLFFVGIAYLVVAISVPTSWGMHLFNESWATGSRLIGFIALQFALIGVIQGSAVVLRGTRNTRTSLVVRICVTPGNIALPLIGAYVDGTRGLGIALVASALIAAIVWWTATLQLHRTRASLAPVGTA
jgi:O-antigen/teichoic acid export membrane protein